MPPPAKSAALAFALFEVVLICNLLGCGKVGMRQGIEANHQGTSGSHLAGDFQTLSEIEISPSDDSIGRPANSSSQLWPLKNTSSYRGLGVGDTNLCWVRSFSFFLTCSFNSSSCLFRFFWAFELKAGVFSLLTSSIISYGVWDSLARLKESGSFGAVQSIGVVLYTKCRRLDVSLPNLCTAQLIARVISTGSCRSNWSKRSSSWIL